MNRRIHMFATTVGTGPFRPAIRFQEKTFVGSETFEKEDDAIKASQELYGMIQAHIQKTLAENGYAPEARK
jgi:hypothetical protein